MGGGWGVERWGGGSGKGAVEKWREADTGEFVGVYQLPVCSGPDAES